MTLNAHKALEQYFHTIVTKQKEPKTMFDIFLTTKEALKAKFTELWTKPTAFVDSNLHSDYEDGYWGFEMYTPEWINEYGETEKPVHTLLIEPHEGTWFEVLDRILDAMEDHYGYSIKEQVYYSVAFPMNDVDERTGKPYAGYGRCINDELFQQLLLAHPELYESYMFGKPVKDLYL